MRNFALCSLLCTCGLALIMSSCEPASSGQQLAPEVKDRTNIRLAKRNAENEFVPGKSFTRAPDHIEQILPAVYQNEGPAWENENIGFRMYFDKRNGIDIHGKKVRDMVLDTVGLDRNTYHEMSDWGMDVLKVGNSLGAGAIAFMIDGEVYRMGDAATETMSIIEDTPDRSSFRIDIDGLELAGRTLNIDWDFTIEAGTHHYESSVTATGLTGGEELLVGIVNLHSDTVYTEELKGRYLIYTHGPQAELDKFLGMALSVDQDSYLGQGEFGPEEQPVSSTYYLRAKLENGKPTAYRFTAGWAPGHPEFKDRKAFLEVIR